MTLTAAFSEQTGGDMTDHHFNQLHFSMQQSTRGGDEAMVALALRRRAIRAIVRRNLALEMRRFVVAAAVTAKTAAP